MNVANTWKTIFKTKCGLLEWLVLPFCLTNSLATFMFLINDIFRPHWSHIVIIYLDDILIFSKISDNHLQHVHTILDLLCQHRLHVKECKYFFGHTTFTYLRFVIEQDEVFLNLAHIQTLANWPNPTTSLELKRFMGGLNFYHKFIAKFPHLACPLHQLSNKIPFI